MHQVTLYGTHTQMGQQHGNIMAKIGLQLPPPDPAMQPFADACEHIVLEQTPYLVEEMRAFADAANVPYNTLKSLLLTIPLKQNIPSCSVVAVMPERTTEGKLVIGRNYDFHYGLSWESATTYHTQPNEGMTHISNSDIWIGREDGLNSAGLFVAMSATFLPGVQPGIPFWFIVRHLLENCKTVEQALEWIQSVPHSQSRNYMLADKQRAVVAEASIEGIYIREPEDGVLVMTNHPAHPVLDATKPFRPDDSPVRYGRLRALIDGPISHDNVKAALNDREHHVCAHGLMFGQPYGTIWSVIACPEDGQLEIAQGRGNSGGEMNYRMVQV